MTRSFEEIGKMQLEDVKPAPLLPRGSYLVGIIGTPEPVTSTQKQTPGWRFRLKPYQARPDVDQQELQNVLAESSMALTDYEMEDDFWITEKSAFMLSNFLQNVMGFSGMSMAQAVAECSGKQFIATIAHTPSKRPDGTMGLRQQIIGRAKAS
jgi:hypothetical protein